MLGCLADALCANPKKFRQFTKTTREFRKGSVSLEYLKIVDCLERVYKERRPKSIEDVRIIMQLLLNSENDNDRRAGRVLRWGVREHDWRPKKV